MASTPRLYDTLWTVFSPQRQVWGDVRRLKTFLWMMVGLILEGVVHLPAWTPYVVRRAQYAASTVRRFARWLHNAHIDPHRIWAAYIQAVLAEWEAVTLVLDTTVLWGRLCWVRVSLVYRGRALPIAWGMLPHRSARVGFSVYRSVLEQAARMLPPHVRVLFLADRGFGDTALMAWLQDRGWSWWLRVKGTLRVYHPRKGWRTVRALVPGRGRALCLHGVLVGDQGPLGPVHLAVGWPLQACAWPTAVGRWPLNSVLRDPQALDRLGLVLAAATLGCVPD